MLAARLLSMPIGSDESPFDYFAIAVSSTVTIGIVGIF